MDELFRRTLVQIMTGTIFWLDFIYLSAEFWIIKAHFPWVLED